MIKNLCVISPEYPSDDKPYIFPFVDQLVCAIADKGVKVCVITPYDAMKAGTFRPLDRIRYTPGGNRVQVYSPAALTLTTRKMGFLNISLLSEKLFIHAVQKTILKQNLRPDLLYAHFLFPAGVCVGELGRKMSIPSVCAFGESSLWSIREIGLDRARKKIGLLSGVVAVSTNNKNVLIENKLVKEEKIKVIVNAVNKKVFCPGDKVEARKRLGLPQDRIIGIYNGSFTKAKGSRRVDAAARGIEGLSMIYLGGGKEEPSDSNILFKGRVSHEEVPLWLRAADFFILPTLEEGCCNAIIEAMSVGLPVITSNKPFNYDILDNNSAILVEPMSIKAIHNALRKIVKSSKLRKKLSEESLRRTRDLDINFRAEKVLDFLESIRQKGWRS